MSEARVHLDLVTCDFEFEGTTDFVRDELRELRELVRAGLLPVSSVVAEEEGLDEEPSAPQSEASAGSATEAEGASKSKKARSRSVHTPKVIKLDLTGGGKNSLEAFAESKKPKSDMDKYEVIAYWLKSALNLDEVGPDHMYTCFKALKWRVPSNIGQGFRNAKRSHAAFEFGSQPGVYTMTHLGDNRVELDLPPKHE